MMCFISYVSVLLGYMDFALFFCTISEKRLIYLKRVIFFHIVIVILTKSWTLILKV